MTIVHRIVLACAFFAGPCFSSDGAPSELHWQTYRLSSSNRDAVLPKDLPFPHARSLAGDTTVYDLALRDNLQTMGLTLPLGAKVRTASDGSIHLLSTDRDHRDMRKLSTLRSDLQVQLSLREVQFPAGSIKGTETPAALLKKWKAGGGTTLRATSVLTLLEDMPGIVERRIAPASPLATATLARTNGIRARSSFDQDKNLISVRLFLPGRDAGEPFCEVDLPPNTTVVAQISEKGGRTHALILSAALLDINGKPVRAQSDKETAHD